MILAASYIHGYNNYAHIQARASRRNRTNNDLLHYENRISKMLAIGRDICFLLACLFTVLALLSDHQYTVLRTPKPKPFFRNSQWVTDFYNGEISPALMNSRNYDVTVVFLYAPWDAQSQDMREEFEATCRYHHQNVYCVAINCWYQEGECRALFSNILYYPILFVDFHHLPSVTYSGIFESSFIIDFISSALHPIHRITSLDQFHYVHNTRDNVLVTFIPMSSKSSDTLYTIFHGTALKYLEIDPRRYIYWAVISENELAEQLGLREEGLMLYQWNATKEYRGIFRRREITQWIFDTIRLSSLTYWVHSNYRIEPLLPQILKNSNAMILFTPRNMFMDFMPSYLMMREVAMSYYNCEHSEKLRQHLQSVTVHRYKYLKELKDLTERCKQKTTSEAYCSSLLKESSSISEERSPDVEAVTRKFTNSAITCSSEEALFTECYTKLYENEPSVRKWHADCSEDSTSAYYLSYFNCIEDCRKARAMRKKYQLSYNLYLKNEAPDMRVDDLPSEGVGCDNNISMLFIAIDSITNREYAHMLGINVTNYVDDTVFIIVDSEEEVTHVLNVSVVDKYTLSEFIYNYTKNKLPRWYKSTSDSSLFMHRYIPNKLENNSVSVRELYSETFVPAVFNSSLHTLVYYYSPSCAYCQVIAHRYLKVADWLKSFPNIEFLRIDGENNDLPWHFTFGRYPLLLIFPAHRKDENRSFPENEILSTRNILEFIIQNVDSKTRILVMLKLCLNNPESSQENDTRHVQECVVKVKAQCLRQVRLLIGVYRKVVYDATYRITDLASSLEKLNKDLEFFSNIYSYLTTLTLDSLDYENFLRLVMSFVAA